LRFESHGEPLVRSKKRQSGGGRIVRMHPMSFAKSSSVWFDFIAEGRARAANESLQGVRRVHLTQIAAVEGLGGLGCGHHGVTPALHVGDRGQQQLEGLLRPAEPEEVDETQDVAAVGALSMVAEAAGRPSARTVRRRRQRSFRPGRGAEESGGRRESAAARRDPSGRPGSESLAAVSATSLTSTAPPRGDKLSAGNAEVLVALPVPTLL
jgi:hypothetical protein